MRTINKLWVEQAWTLRSNLGRLIEKKKRILSEGPVHDIERLVLIQEKAYTRYLRRLKKYWA